MCRTAQNACDGVFEKYSTSHLINSSSIVPSIERILIFLCWATPFKQNLLHPKRAYIRKLTCSIEKGLSGGAWKKLNSGDQRLYRVCFHVPALKQQLFSC